MSFSGFLSWDVADCHVDLEEELNTITQHAPEGEEARHGKSNGNKFIGQPVFCLTIT